MPSEVKNSASLANAPPPAVHLVVSRWMVLLLAVSVIAPWPLVVYLLASRSAVVGNASQMPTGGRGGRSDDASRAEVGAGRPSNAASGADAASANPPPQEWVAGKKGPWGQLDSLIFAIDVPDESLLAPPADQPPVRWTFAGYSKEKVLAELRSAGVAEDEVKKLDTGGKWTTADGMVAVEPGDRLILSLTPEVRSKLYAVLAASGQNLPQANPVWYRPGMIDWQLADSGLAAESVSLLKRLLYKRGENSLLFADFDPALRSLPDAAERKRFMRAISRKRSVLARLRLEPDSDVEQIAQYWGIGGRRKDLLPLLDALHRVENGCRLNIVCLLPDFVRDHLYSHPSAFARDKAVKMDCLWTSMNFFNDPPDNRFTDIAYVHEVLDREYYKIQEPSQLADLVFLTLGVTVVHVAAYVADDLVFTKNGDDLSQPWILMHISGMMETHAVKYPPGAVKVQYFRKKSL